MKDLTIEIPKKYKKALIERFSLKNAVKEKIGVVEKEEEYIWTINKKCPLCKIFLPPNRCGKCPFIKFGQSGCLKWMEELLGPEPKWRISPGVMCIWWCSEDDKKARKEMKLLKKKARKLITWV